MRLSRSNLVFGLLTFSLLAAVPGQAQWETAKRAFDQGDYATALKELRPLAEKGEPQAQALLGLMYNLGRGVPLDMAQALKWYKASADQGDAEGEFHLGTMYLNGSGVGRDTAQGLKWLKLSAEQGQRDAYLLLGMAYMNLNDAPRDVVEADMWLRLAAAHGDPLAPGQRAKLEGHMTRDQIKKAQSLAAAWQPKLTSHSHDKEKAQ